MDNQCPVYYKEDNGKVFKCFPNKARVEVFENEMLYPANILQERSVQHIKRCVVQPHVSGKLDKKMIQAYYQYGFLDNDEYAYYLECVELDRKVDE